MKPYYLLYLLIFALIGLYACKESEDPDDQVTPEPDTVVISDTFVSSPWRVEGVTANDTSKSTQNVQITFDTNKQYTLILPWLQNFGSTGSWTLDKTTEPPTIRLDDGNTEMLVKVIDLDKDSMTIEFISNNYKGREVKYQLSLKSSA
ncbi:hypothetical protein PZB74_03840 [Porifericola rhodea]|uniref:hypothetical protein n=1 Tax=Porifericola rhodea TaxID=930972 RepID=UPI0026671378|nr:hypothetical protein [Porifericola rhodea]WKN32478.1 hypothetical protein PZB74_03840 [Porifericola rhodea]